MNFKEYRQMYYRNLEIEQILSTDFEQLIKKYNVISNADINNLKHEQRDIQEKLQNYSQTIKEKNIVSGEPFQTVHLDYLIKNLANYINTTNYSLDFRYFYKPILDKNQELQLKYYIQLHLTNKIDESIQQITLGYSFSDIVKNLPSNLIVEINNLESNLTQREYLMRLSGESGEYVPISYDEAMLLGQQVCMPVCELPKILQIDKLPYKTNKLFYRGLKDCVWKSMYDEITKPKQAEYLKQEILNLKKKQANLQQSKQNSQRETQAKLKEAKIKFNSFSKKENELQVKLNDREVSLQNLEKEVDTLKVENEIENINFL